MKTASIRRYATLALAAFCWLVPPPAVRATQVAQAPGAGIHDLSMGEIDFDLSADALLQGVSSGSVAWGDFDNDGLLDAAITGHTFVEEDELLHRRTFTRIYRNNGDGTFTDIEAALPALDVSNLAWGDFNQNGRLDLAVSGYLEGTLDRITRIYRNEGDGSFTDIEAGLHGVGNGNLVWGDFNNNGRLDLAICGSDGSGVTRIYRNDGDGSFTDIEAGLPGISSGALAWGDFDGSGYLDLALSGSSVFGRITRIYRNNGDGTFTDIEANLLGVADSSLAWGDFDGDGHLDLAVMGHTGTGRSTRIYRNVGDGSFALQAELTGLSHGTVRWADVNSSGQPDLIVTGQGASGPATLLFANADGVFTEAAATLTNVMQSAAAFGDFNNNGRLDLLLAGNTRNDLNYADSVTLLYENTSIGTNTPPTPPDSFELTYANSELRLNWSGGGDFETPAGGLSYNLRIGTTPGGFDVMAPMADAATGFRRLPAMGRMQTTSFPMHDLTSGVTYYWAVQTIDAAFAGSAWSDEQTLAFHTIRGRITRTDGRPPPPTEVLTNNQGGSTVTDPEGHFEVMVPAGWSGRLFPSLDLYLFDPPRRDYSDVQQDLEDQNFTATPPVWEGVAVVTLGAVEMARMYLTVGDVNHSGRMDIVHVGMYYDPDTGMYRRRIRLHRNEDDRQFTGKTLRNDTEGYIAFGDHNNNGYLDLAFVWFNEYGFRTSILENTTEEQFLQLAAASSVGMGAVAWGDFNNDGRQDLAAVGKTGHSTDGLFLEENTGNPWSWPTVYSDTANFDSINRLAWADFDNDGDLDLLFTSFNMNRTRMLRNDGAGGFTVVDVGVIDLNDSTYAWGDYNNNGWLDLAICGWRQESMGGPVSRIYRNNGDGTFTDIEAGLPALSRGSLAWGDYNNNGRVDLAIMGEGPDGVPVTRVFRNDGGDVFTDAGAELVQVHRGQLAWADFDNDGLLDLVVTGRDALDRNKLIIYYNNHEVAPNTPPSPPAILQAELMDEFTVTFSWDAGSDAETPEAGLSYNLRVGTAPGGNEIFSGLADADGWRRLSALGNAQKRTSWTLNDLPPGILYWAVQSIDSAWAGSAWSEEQTFEVIDTRPPVTIETIKLEPDDEWVRIEGVLVSAAFSDVFYIQDEDVPLGIRVLRAGHSAVAGQRVDVEGALTTNADGERQINADLVDPAAGSGLVQRWGLSNASLGGGDWHYEPGTGAGQRGVSGGTGANTIGLRVRIWGEVTRTGSGYLYVDDGAGLLDGTTTGGQPNVGVRVVGNPAGWMAGDFLEVNGISSCFQSGDGTARRVLAIDVGGFQEVPNASPMGVPLGWYLSHGIAPLSGFDWEHDWSDVDGYDTDQDGMLDWQEFVADTDPTDPGCYFMAVTVDAGPPPAVVFMGSADRVYTLLGRTDLRTGDWSAVPGAGPRPGAGGEEALADENEPPRGPFYRLQVELP